MIFRHAFLGIGLAASVVGGAQAQNATVDERFLSASCSGAGFSCVFNVQQTITRLRQSGISAAALNAQIGRIAAIVSTQVTTAMPTAARARIAEALNVAAANSTDPLQQNEIQLAAATIAASSEGTSISVPALESSPT